ncbi:MAG: DUF2334 domain-containing protein [Bacillota bacterium]
MVLIAIIILALTIGGCKGVVVSGEDNLLAEVTGPGSYRMIKPALLRLEDVCPGGPFHGQENMEKMRVIADYLQSEGIPFHVSLIPRMVSPAKEYDVKITDDTPYAREFVEMLKHMESRGGIIGVHGYTHQTGSQVSGHGFEFYHSRKNPEAPDTLDYARERIKTALDLFREAGITPSYWETPHYTASLDQYPAFEEQTGLIYENHYRGVNTIRPRTYDFDGRGYRGFITVPTPLGYINPDVSTERMIKTLDRLNGDLASFFYHPFREFGYIKKEEDAQGNARYVYDPNSPLHFLIKSFMEKGYTFVSINTLAKFVPAHRLESLKFAEGDLVLAGRFVDGGGEEILVWNKDSNQWRVYQYTSAWHTPRKTKAFEDRGVIMENWKLDNDSIPLVGDFNGNKKDDLMVFSPGRKDFVLAENSEGRLIPRGGASLKIPELKSGYPLAGDFNGDGLYDLAVYDREGGRIGIAINTPQGFGQVVWQHYDVLKKNNVRLLTGDFNGDGKCDILVLNYGSGWLNVLLSGPEGGFTPAAGAWMKMWGAMGQWEPAAADVNGNGKSDLVFYNKKRGQWQIAVSDGTRFIYRGGFGPWGKNKGGVSLVKDLNGDRKSDLIIVNGSRDKGYKLDTALSVLEK